MLLGFDTILTASVHKDSGVPSMLQPADIGENHHYSEENGSNPSHE